MTPCHDHVTAADRLAPANGIRPRTVCMPRVPVMASERGRYVWTACDADSRRTWRRWAAETGNPLPAFLAEPGDVLPANDRELPVLMRRQAS